MEAYLAVDVVKVTLDEAGVFLSSLYLEDTGFILRAIRRSVREGVGLPQCPKKFKSNQTILQHGVEAFLDLRIILV